MEKATIENRGLDKLGAWLREREARCMWEETIPRVGTVTAYLVRRTIVLVLTYKDDDRVMGWDLFVPATADGRVDATLAHAAAIVDIDAS